MQPLADAGLASAGRPCLARARRRGRVARRTARLRASRTTESMPARCSRCESIRPAGPAPMMPTWVRIGPDGYNGHPDRRGGYMTNVEIVRAFYEAVARGEVDAAIASLADDVAWTEAEGFPYAGTKVGPAAVKGRSSSASGRSGTHSSSIVRRSSTQAILSSAWAPTRARTRRRVARCERCRPCLEAAGRKVRAFEQFVDTLKVAEALRAET